ncbi:hypothetical protein LOZ53_000192 [Ophidiomyces ophidiicola]|nr:hypothetical protein LOZ55_001713 [Ophidiomyces ophidiicola]KAI1991738.1 hypothetical protein LOZ54_001985 [Ophidiomyces ophidiicola]KAI1994526.1 hypothetical protein LOZ51_003719 [Ophidiomyces ophidiicola]KAI1997786.1 hypothetical protein LOZ53_000192 [Ophidiomyces ophidiicola]
MAFFSVSFLQFIAFSFFLIPHALSSPTKSLTEAKNGKCCVFPPLIKATAEQLQAGLAARCYTSVHIVQAYLDRIKEVNGILRPVAEINPDALKIAADLDNERACKKLRGPLHGLPVLIKGNIGTNDKLQTTAGSTILLNSTLYEDATVAKKLREAGIIILGKTGLSQWSNFRGQIPNGWSAFGGRVYAAYSPNQDPSGSSSGSGVASDLGLAWATLGTETIGSIVSPAEMSNVVGVKPTVGLTSRHLVIPIAAYQDTVGPMTRTVKDAAFLLQAIAGKDAKDKFTSEIPSIPDYVAAVPTQGREADAIFEKGLKDLEKAGAIIVQDVKYEDTAETQLTELLDPLLGADFNKALPDYLKQLKSNPNNLRTVSDIRRVTQKSPKENYPEYNTSSWDAAIKLGYDSTSPKFQEMRKKAVKLTEDGCILRAIKKYKLDGLVLPTAMSPLVPGVYGSPIITVPIGSTPVASNSTDKSTGFVRPVGIAFFAERWSEEKLFGFAYDFEQVTQVRDTQKRYIEPKAGLKEQRRKSK